MMSPPNAGSQAGEAHEPTALTSTKAAETPSTVATGSAQESKDGKQKKRSFFGLGKKKDNDLKSASTTIPTLSNENSARSEPPAALASPTRSFSGTGYRSPSSPRRGLESSAGLASPAESLIFERNVQDSTMLPPNSPAIPTHIQTENHIPPVLDQASAAITNETLHPDSVEIVTHTSHQPAAVTVTGTGGAGTPYDYASDWRDDLETFDNKESLGADNASNYGSFDSHDVRRLSFISFADVVQAEHLPGGPAPRDSIYLAGMTSIPSANANRSPSPIRSPVSSQGPETSPPTSNPGSIKGLEMSPPRKALGSPTSMGHQSLAAPGGDLNIETMSQALRRTGSTDLSSFRSAPNSPLEGPSIQ